LAFITSDISEYISKIFKKYSPAAGMVPLPNNERAILHSACHSRAQNIGNRAQQILQHIPKLSVSVVNKCSGHGGLWGCKSSTHASALKTGHAAKVAIEKSIEKAKKEASVILSAVSAALTLLQGACSTCTSECPLASSHLAHMLSAASNEGQSASDETYVLSQCSADTHAADAVHPIQLIARSYRLGEEQT
jgi:glycerol-3-phosphate dehydrogenase subunit C